MQFERKKGEAIPEGRAKKAESGEHEDEGVGLNRKIDAFLQDKSDNELDEDGNSLDNNDEPIERNRGAM